MMSSRRLLPLACSLVLSSCAAHFPATEAAEANRTVFVPAWAQSAGTSVVASHAVRDFDTTRIPGSAPAAPLDRFLRSRGSKRVGMLSLHHAPLPEALRMLASTGGFNVVIADDVPTHEVTLDLKHTTVEHAFRALVEASRVDATLVGGDIVLVRNVNH